MYYICILGLIWNLGLVLQSLISLSVLKRLRSITPAHINNSIVIVIPVRNEKTEHLEDCARFFLAQKDVSKLIICLTEINGDYKKYINILNSIISTDKRISYLTYNGIDGHKAEQINVALKMICNSDEDFVVGIYDIDSRPDVGVFEYIKTNEIEVGQQPILYDGNLNDLGLLTTAGSFHQSSWSISFEIFNFIFAKSRLVYAVGHGLFLSSHVLKECGLFEEKCITEDLMYGYKVSLARLNFNAIPFYEHAKFIKKISDFIPQSVRWYGGELELINRFPGWLHKFGDSVSSKKKYWLRIVELVWWPLERMIYITALVGFLLGSVSFELVLFYSLVLVISGYVSAIIFIKENGWNYRLVVAPLLIPVWHIFSVIGPLIAIIKKIFGTRIEWTITKK